MAKKPSKASAATRQRLRDFGVEEAVAFRTDLTEFEAHQILNERMEALALEKLGEPPASHLGRVCLPLIFEEEAIDVVGTRHYKKAVKAAFDRSCYVKDKARAWAVLVPEPENSHDENAVAVYIGGDQVGHLEADTAESVQHDLLLILESKGGYLCCPAEISLVDKGKYEIFLFIEEEQICKEAGPPRPLGQSRGFTMKDSQPNNGLSAADLQKVMASQKSFVGSAVVVFLLYWFCYVPGLIFNIMWLEEARKIKRLTGKAPAGMGCLYIMFLLGLIPLIFIGVVFFGGAAAFVGESQQQTARTRPSQPVAESAPAASMQREEIDFELQVGDTLIAHEPILVFDSKPGTVGGRSVVLRQPFAFTVEALTDGWIEATVRRYVGDQFSGWIRLQDVEGKEVNILLAGETLEEHIPARPVQ